jgi:ring-1,2-phenylacetyl-CoA epoxidase subunit PaaD
MSPGSRPGANPDSGGPDALADDVRRAVATVTDPEYPDLTIVQLGMLEAVRATGGGRVEVDLVPTVLGCPALREIEADVVAAASKVPGVAAVDVRFLAQPAWTADRVAPDARDRLAREYTITIRAVDGSTICPVCGGRNVEERSAFGPTVCRSVAWCPDCRNPVEVLRMTATSAPGAVAGPGAGPVGPRPSAGTGRVR